MQVVPLIYYPLFFSLTGLVQGLTVEETVARGKEKFVGLIGRNLQFWLPVQIIQFEFVPMELQVGRAPPQVATSSVHSLVSDHALPMPHSRCSRRRSQVTWVAAFGLVWKIILSTLAGNAKADIPEECILDDEVISGDVIPVECAPSIEVYERAVRNKDAVS